MSRGSSLEPEREQDGSDAIADARIEGGGDQLGLAGPHGEALAVQVEADVADLSV